LLEQLRKLEVEKNAAGVVQTQIARAAAERGQADQTAKDVEQSLAQRTAQAQLASLSLEELRQRSNRLASEILQLEKLPSTKKPLRFRTPVSKVVRSDEVFFECRGGRVTYIDLPAFLQEVRGRLDDHVVEVRSRGRVSASTTAVGAFRLRYTIERETQGLWTRQPRACASACPSGLWSRCPSIAARR
jgi:hypothetical protein